MHGIPLEIFKIVERTRVELDEVPNVHWYCRNAVLSRSNEFWSKIEEAMSEIGEHAGPDQSFAEFLDEFSAGSTTCLKRDPSLSRTILGKSDSFD